MLQTGADGAITQEVTSMEKAAIRVEKVIIPTYEIGEPEKTPIFLDKRVYQGSSGKVYPYSTIERIGDKKYDKEYTAVILENEYLEVMVLPELGGRIQRAFDKTNQYDFVYYNHVIKPALVGLTGPWISGGIEFNWPQHHRPTTFSPVDYVIEEREDGSCFVLLHDVDQMYGTKGIAKIGLYPGKAYIEITGQLYNRTAMPQTFLWWANPAVPVNEQTQSVFPPDVHAVMDHGKRDVSRFPIATGVYYKQDYSEGVDISRYRNIPVPTSYMAEKSRYDFVGGYDYGKQAGILHVADHHISPGKKQWTWGCGDFGKAWDRNLTDEDGPYVELMTGVFTDNQPDFTWLKPFEEKVFRQYFMPYKAVGQVKNATVEAAVHLSLEGEQAHVIVYATSRHKAAHIVLKVGKETVWEESVALSPVDIYEKKIPLGGKVAEEQLHISVWAEENCLVEYRPEPEELPRLPDPARAAKEPEEIRTNEELLMTGQHIEQYRHATYLPDPYYLEGLKRDAGDIRINNAYGLLLLRRGLFQEAEKYFCKALERLTERNPNPFNSETYYNLGLCLFYQGKREESYDAFYKATWSNEQQEMSFYYLAALDAGRGVYGKALEHIERALVKNAHNIKARGLKAYLLRKCGRQKEAVQWIAENLELDPFDYVSGYELLLWKQKGCISGQSEAAEQSLQKALQEKMRNFPENYLMTARDYAEAGAYEEAIGILEQCTAKYPLLYYYRAYYTDRGNSKAETAGKSGGVAAYGGESAESMSESIESMPESAENMPDTVGKLTESDKTAQVSWLLVEAEQCAPDYCFPNKLEDMAVLQFAIERGCLKRAPYYLGNLEYDKLQWETAWKLWEHAAAADDSFAIVHRNLALAYYNRAGQPDRALVEMEKAFALEPDNIRILLELDQLHKKLGWSFALRCSRLEEHPDLIEKRDDLYIEYITLLNMTGRYEDAYRRTMSHHFHPWEGGEGKITTQYTLSLLQMAKKALSQEQYATAEELLRKALIYPENLGEGKLEGTKDNHLYYHLALALEAQGKKEEAIKSLELATQGTDEPAGAMYYNDQPADMILYQGLAHLRLGHKGAAQARFYRLLDYGEQHLEDEVKTDYFAVSLPDFLIFEENDTVRNRAHCYYLMALGHLGLEDREKAEHYFAEALKMDPSHMMSHIFTQSL